ncbi:hypothetical protein LPJ66_001735 [Kickxella alabastrina]|uniref:Uncharacterized protein n=1 Tax=Kickxella alabastrina TaxID=61397 RepID=A0ACC1ISE7_9FUNG|nr:hypothetical protein LPJ66_001735 [Kickxella alabastrina]
MIVKRLLEMGPEDPSEIIYRAMDILRTKQWGSHMANGLGSSLCGAIVIFLACVHFWRPAIVNRVSLRLIFAISIYDFIECLIQAVAKTTGVVSCRTNMFFSVFFGYASVYTSTSIAVNLYITLYGGGLASLPRYIEYLYFAVPLGVSLLHWVPPTIWAATHGYCSAFDPVPTGTPQYIAYVVGVQLLIPFLALLFNVVISVRVIVGLIMQQRKISCSLREISETNREFLIHSSDGSSSSGSDCPTDVSTSVSGTPKNDVQAKETRRQLERSFRVMHKFNSAAIRIALYPCAPIAWWVINTMFYALQYDLTMTFKEDANRWVYMVGLSWFSIPAIAFANFIVFITDPAFVKAYGEVRKSLLALLFGGRRESMSTMVDRADALDGGSSNYQRMDSLKSMLIKARIADAESGLVRSSFDTEYSAPAFDVDTAGDVAQAYSTAATSTYKDLVRRHPTVGSSVDANHVYSKI